MDRNPDSSGLVGSRNTKVIYDGSEPEKPIFYKKGVGGYNEVYLDEYINWINDYLKDYSLTFTHDSQSSDKMTISLIFEEVKKKVNLKSKIEDDGDDDELISDDVLRSLSTNELRELLDTEDDNQTQRFLQQLLRSRVVQQRNRRRVEEEEIDIDADDEDDDIDEDDEDDIDEEDMDSGW